MLSLLKKESRSVGLRLIKIGHFAEMRALKNKSQAGERACDRLVISGQGGKGAHSSKANLHRPDGLDLGYVRFYLAHKCLLSLKNYCYIVAWMREDVNNSKNAPTMAAENAAGG
jgi:hypothetical protein